MQNLLPSLKKAHRQRIHPSECQIIALRIVVILCDLTSGMILVPFVAAGFVHNWLAQYPFGDASLAQGLDQPKRLNTVMRFIEEGEGEPCHTEDLKQIFVHLQCHSFGRESLAQAGMQQSRRDFVNDRRLERQRNVDTDADEMQRRRIRREAVVMGEEGRPIERRDIIQRSEDHEDRDAELVLENQPTGQTLERPEESLFRRLTSLLARV